MPKNQPMSHQPNPDGLDARPTAVLYLRVSSVGQMNKAHDPEGYSIPSQREVCKRYAERLGAEVIAEFVEYGQSGTSIRRGELQRLLSELPKLQPTYVVVYDISRLARDDYDALWLYAEIERHGSKLESTLERIDDSPAGRLLYTVMAGVNAFRSRGDAVKVKAGLDRKHAEGGTIGLAPIGYINTRERIEGREVRTIALDEERAHLVRTAFDAFASGEHSLTTLRDLLENVGLTTKETPKKPAKALSRSGVYRILQDPYYIGQVTRNGVSRKGLHPKLVNEATFEKVQELLDVRRLSGDRSRKHHHYLKGSLFCSCGRRLTWGRHRGNGGTYEYFCCLSNQAKRKSCGNRYMAADAVERAVEDHYRRVSLTEKQCEAIRIGVREQAEARLAVAREESEQHTRRLRTLQDEQQKLLRLYYRGGVSEDILIAEQARIETERTQARKLVETAAHEAEDIFEALDEALLLIGPNCHAAYMSSPPEHRRLLNQAIFQRLIVTPDDIEDEPQPVVADLHRLTRKAPAAPKAPKGRQKGRGPQFLGGHGSHVDTLVRPSGLEPPRGNLPTRPSTLRVYQFRHGRREARVYPRPPLGPAPAAANQVAPHLRPSTPPATVRTDVRSSPDPKPEVAPEMDLTKRQQEIFDFIHKYSAKYGYPPTVRDIGKAVGLASSSTVHAHLANLERIGLLRRDPSKPRAIELLDRAVGNAVDSVRNIVRSDSLPLVGTVAAGQPVLAEENVEEYVSVPEAAGGSSGEYLLRIRGESMKNVGIIEGDLVVVSPQDTARDGEIVVALLGEEATVKRFFREPDHIRLQPENETMEPIRSKEVKVLGRVVGLLRSM